MNHNLSSNVEVRRIKVDGTNFTKSAGTGDTLTSEAVDTLGYEGVQFMWVFGAVVDGGACYIKTQQSSDDAATDTYDDLAGSKQTIADADDNKVRISDYYRPGKRYMKALTVRATQNLTVDGLFALLYRPVQKAVTQGSTVAGTETFQTPAEGTA